MVYKKFIDRVPSLSSLILAGVVFSAGKCGEKARKEREDREKLEAQKKAEAAAKLAAQVPVEPQVPKLPTNEPTVPPKNNDPVIEKSNDEQRKI